MRAATPILVALAAVRLAAQEPTAVADATALRQALANAKPGAVITLAPGDYEAVHGSGIRGAVGRPVTVRAAPADRPPRFVAGLHLSDVEHLVLDGLLIEGAPGNGLNIDDGGTFDTPSRHVELRAVTVRDVGGAGNHDGIKLSGVVDFRVVGCTIERWGRGGSAIDMVGCQRGRIEGCTIRDRADGAAANGVQMKGGTRDVVVHRCRFVHAGQRAVQLGGSTGRAFFRPAPAGFEAKDLVVEGCTFEGSLAPIAFVGCDGATVRHNTFVQPSKWIVRILQETRDADFVPCRGGAFTDNLIVWRGAALTANVGPGTAPESFTFARNWWFRSNDAEHSTPGLPVAERDAVHGRDPRLDAELAPNERAARSHGAHSLPQPR